jgi:RNA polymerase sigma-70 factor (ECF subfamily)
VEGLAELAFRRHHAQIYRYLHRKTGDPHRAEDLAQEVFADATVALSRDGFRPDSMSAWLYTIAQRRFVDDLRRRPAVRALSEEALDELAAPGREDEVGGVLGEAIDNLPARQRQLIAMKLLRGCTFAEIATALGVSEAAAKMRFQRALRALRAELEQRGIEP